MKQLTKTTDKILQMFWPLVYSVVIVLSSSKLLAQESTYSGMMKEQELSENALIEKYYDEIKATYHSDDRLSVFNEYLVDGSKFRWTMDEYARLKALTRVILVDAIEKKVKKGEAIEAEFEKLKRFEAEYTSYKDYVARTKTEAYGRQWETKTRDGELRLYFKDLDNKTTDEEQRLEEKISVLKNDLSLMSLLMTDGNKSVRVVLDKVTNEPKEIDVTKEAENEETDEEVEIQEVKEVEVPFAKIDKVPAYKGCERRSTNKERQKCTSDEISRFVAKNFDVSLAKPLGLQGRQRISVFFKIDKEGKVNSIRARASHPKLEEEAKRVVQLLPKFTPGTQNGQAVTVPYSLPIVFQVASVFKNED